MKKIVILIVIISISILFSHDLKQDMITREDVLDVYLMGFDVGVGVASLGLLQWSLKNDIYDIADIDWEAINIYIKVQKDSIGKILQKTMKE